MAIRNIVQMGDDVLRKVSVEVEVFDKKLIDLLDDMKDTLKKADGAGLACVQIGLLKRVFIIDTKETGYYEFVNPKILFASGSQLGKEGCLSVKGKWGKVKRPNTVKIEAFDRKGEKFTLTAHGFFARAICHEYDHLDGILYVDKALEVWEERR